MSKITNDVRLNPVWHWRMLYSCTHMAPVGVKGFDRRSLLNVLLSQNVTNLPSIVCCFVRRSFIDCDHSRLLIGWTSTRYLMGVEP